MVLALKKCASSGGVSNARKACSGGVSNARKASSGGVSNARKAGSGGVSGADIHDSLAAVPFVCEAKRGVETSRRRCGLKEATTEAVYCGDGAQTHDAHSLSSGVIERQHWTSSTPIAIRHRASSVDASTEEDTDDARRVASIVSRR